MRSSVRSTRTASAAVPTRPKFPHIMRTVSRRPGSHRRRQAEGGKHPALLAAGTPRPLPARYRSPRRRARAAEPRGCTSRLHSRRRERARPRTRIPAAPGRTHDLQRTEGAPPRAVPATVHAHIRRRMPQLLPARGLDGTRRICTGTRCGGANCRVSHRTPVTDGAWTVTSPQIALMHCATGRRRSTRFRPALPA